MNFSSLIQFIIGFILGVFLLVTGSAVTAYFFFTKMANNPPSPVFAEEKQQVEETKASEKPTKASETNTAEKETKPEQASAKPTPEATPEEKKETKEEEKLPPGAYKAVVNWSEGLSLRDEPNAEANRIGGVGYNWEIIILEESSDKQWQKIRIPSSGEEGWVKAGNVDKVTEEQQN